MYRTCCCILLAGAGLIAQTPRVPSPSQAAVEKLSASVTALRNAGAPGDAAARQLADNMMALATNGPRPERADVDSFAGEFTRALAGRKFSDDQAAVLRQCLVDMVRGTGISNYSVAQRLRETLTAVRRADDATNDLIVRRFLAIGEGVRGPDDAPMRINYLPKQK